ncbi:probable E3 ubiquitin-protein ligase RNF217 [Durio zibethinus]|uniref:RBR-type E3 ubiquitin transferase n=1 Tax=Durio zibethinus TaxID=66656 RepID=A0A6P6A7L1_DURZI|nr:probable E3 ubiquitin-protein ligase RNF217 [Durio zibethinus]
MGNFPGKPRKALENPQEEEDPDSSFTCEICIEPTLASKKFKNTNICRHPFCQDCIAKYIEVKIQDNNAKIECPEPSCQYHLDPLVCRPMISATLFSTWCDLLCENCLLGSERSYCPNRNCLALVVNECRGNVKKAKCPNCKQLFCFQCQTVWHAGYHCEESEQMRDRNDVLFGQLVERKKWTRCPGCGQCVERLHGCSVVKCSSFQTPNFMSGTRQKLLPICKLGGGWWLQMQDGVLLPLWEKINKHWLRMQAQFWEHDNARPFILFH